ncbi:MAG: polysaccharide biosynthesis tyrosine autokinase [Polyangiaceae bacterium]
MTLVGTLESVRRSWASIVAFVAIAFVGGLLYTRSQPRIYQSQALIEFDPRIANPLAPKGGGIGDFTTYWDNREYIETQQKLVTSDVVLRQVVRDLDLQHDPEFSPPRSDGALTPVEDLAANIRAVTTIEAVKGSRLVIVRVEATQPERARRLCEAIATTFASQNLESKIAATGDAAAWLSSQIDALKKELEANENALHDFKQKNELPSTSINDSSNMVRIELTAFDEALTTTRTRKAQLLARHTALAKISDENVDELPVSEFLSSQFVQQLRQQYLSATKARKELLAEGRGENHPSVLKATEQVSESRAALLSEVRNIKGAISRDLTILAQQESGELALYESARKRAVDLNMKEIEYHRLDRARVQNEKLFSMLLERMKEADLARMMKVNNIRIVDFPSASKSPIRPNTSLNLTTAAVFGLLLGLAFAVVRAQMDSTLKVPADVEQKLGVTFLGLMPAMTETGDWASKRLRTGTKKKPRRPASGSDVPELIVHDYPASAVAEAARSARTNIMFMNPDGPHRRILITSAAPAEGKTTVACSIAIAMAQSGKRVVIVDCDMRKPRLHRIFGRSGDAGLTNYLAEGAHIDEIAKPTVVDGLSCIPAGPTPPSPADMLHSERFRNFLDELSARFDLVILDSPPVVAVTDSAIVSTLVDTIIFVVRAFETRLALCRQGLRILQDVEAPICGVILNAVDFERSEYNSYYGYGYYRQEHYGQPPGLPTGVGSDDPQDHSSSSAPN